MRVSFLLPGLGITGGARVVFEYANRLSKRGHEVTVLHPIVPSRMDTRWFAPKSRTKQILQTLVHTVRDHSVSWFDLEVPTQRIPALAPSVAGYFDHSFPEADVLVATSWETAYTVAALDESKGQKVYFVQHYEIWDTWNSEDAWYEVATIADNPNSHPIEMYEVTPPSPDAQRQKELVDRSYELPLSKITISSWLCELLETKFDQEVHDVITNSVNHSTFYPEETGESDELNLLLPYRKQPWKGRREAEQLITEFNNRNDIGIHTYNPHGTPSVIPDGVTHHSNLTDTELRHLYSKADIFVLPSWVEGCQLPPLEAMACKCAVVATDVGGVPDYGKDGVTMSVVPPRNANALIDAVAELIRDDNKRRQLKEQGHEDTTQYTWDDATAQFEEVLSNLAWHC